MAPRVRAETGPLPDDVLDAIERLCADGLFLQARGLGERYRPLHAWRGVRGLLLGSRLTFHLGDPRRAAALAALAWRHHPDDLAAKTAQGRELLLRAGPLRAWEFMRRHDGFTSDVPSERAEWLALDAVVLAALRDFERASNRIERAVAEASDHAWVLVESSTVLMLEDRHEEALAAARRALALQPRYGAAIQACVEALRRLGRSAEALELLRETAPHLESFTLTQALVAHLCEAEAFLEARSVAARLPDLAPLLPARARPRLHALLSDIAYRVSDDATALTEARAAGPGFHAHVAERLAGWQGSPRRVQLPAPFVRQHFRTCGPATLTSLARFWGFSVEHDALARQIAYEGTWDHEERHWAETSLGCAVREFTVTWDAAVALLDRGIPFSLTLVGPTAGHLQAVIGYDARRGVLLVQDPTVGLAEHLAILLDQQAVTGPRGMALVPPAHAHQLDDCPLPDADRWDALYRLKRALAAHDRAAAGREVEHLARDDERGRLTLEARRTLAMYDGDLEASLACVEGLLERYPDSELLAAQKYGHLATLARRSERLALVEEMIDRPTCDPVWWQYGAWEYLQDARSWPQAERCARRAMRQLPDAAPSYHVLAAIRSRQRRFDEACALARFAACLNPTDDFLAESYRGEAAASGRVEEALAWLAWRATRDGAQAGRPAQTRFSSLARTYRFPAAFAALTAVLEARPDDADLLLFAAREYARDGDHARADALLARARPTASPSGWARAAADVAAATGDLPRAVELWREVAAAHPLDLPTHVSLTQSLDQLEGRDRAAAYVRDLAQAWPHHLGIQQLYLEWLRAGDAGEAVRVLQELVQAHPTFAWAQRELAIYLARQGHAGEAASAADAALALDPHSSQSHAVRAFVHARAGERAAASAGFREAIRLDADNGFAITELVDGADGEAGRRQALAFVREQLAEQTVSGPGLVAYRAAARAVLPPAEVLELCRAALAARPDLLPAWTETIRQLLDIGDAAAARDLAVRAIGEFPVIAELHQLRAQALLHLGDRIARLQALSRARELAPTQPAHGVALGSALSDAGQFDEACRVLQETVRRAPADSDARLALGDVFWARARRDEAVAAVKQTIERNPGVAAAWERLQQWSAQLGDVEAALSVARRLVTERPRDARAWKALASVAGMSERVRALRRAVTLAPQDAQARDSLAIALAQDGQFEEALATCQAPELGPVPPLLLRGRAAWLEAVRGQRQEAIRCMRRLLDEDGSYAWGWLQLADWCAEEKDTDGALQAAVRLTRLLPGDAEAWAQFARIQLRAGRRADAKTALRRAVDLSPTHAWAGLLLIDVMLDDRERDAARVVVERLQRHGEGADLLLRVVRLAAAFGDRWSAGSAFSRLCSLPSVTRTTLQPAAEVLVAMGLTEIALDQLRQRVNVPAASPDVAEVLGVVELDGGQDLDTFAAFVLAHPLGSAAAGAFLRSAAERRQFVAGHALDVDCRARFEKDSQVWATYGSLLLEEARYADVVKWMAGWNTRQDLAPWMLVPLAEALRALGRWSTAALVHREALRLPQRHGIAPHACWLALDDVLAGRAEPARASLALIAPDQLTPYYQTLHRLALACLEGTSDPRRGTVLVNAVIAGYRPGPGTALERAYLGCRAVSLRRTGGTANRLRAWLLERRARTR